MRTRYLATLGVSVAIAALVLFVQGAAARFDNSGAGGCGNFSPSLSAALPGDVLAPMRGGVSTNGATITQTLVIQGGWTPSTGDCSGSGTNHFADASAMVAAGFTYDPSQRSNLFGDSVNSVLRVSLTTGQTTALENLDISSAGIDVNGNAISGTLNGGARLRLENMSFDSNQSGVNAIGGAVYIEVRGGSQLVISNSTFTNNNAISGGAVEVRLFDNSSLLIEGSTFDNNEALSANGGALRVVVNSGTVTLRNNSFTNNRALSGSGGAVSIERATGATGAAYWISQGNSFSGNSASSSSNSFSSVDLLSPRAYTPLIQQPGSSSSFAVAITGITLSDAQYKATFTTSGYTPVMPGRHIHFFFNTVPPSQAGIPGSGPYAMYGSSAPFTEYGIVNRPAGATQLCALVANADHSVIQGTGNCVSLP